MEPAGPTPVILVVDDEPVFAHALTLVLRSGGGRKVIEVHDPLDALQLIEHQAVDLVITDKDMPGISGHELIDLLKDRHPDIPCIMLTGTPSLDSALLAINREQVVRYLTKPCNPAELEATVSAGLARRATLRAAASDKPTGDLDQRYEIVGTLGEGGMGTVFRAVHRALGRPVALKILNGTGARDPVTRARFVREARAATRARHPRIVETLDFGHLADGRPYLVMELVDADTLSVRLKRGPMAPRDAVKVAIGVAEALIAAHAVGVVHRDLKPGNVFVDDKLEIKLGDFGAARLLEPDELGAEAITRVGVTIGTPHYMAPEQIMGQAVDGRCDIYALGCVLFRMLSGHSPYKAADVRGVLTQHLHAPIPVVTSPAGELPPILVETVRKAMAKDAGNRQQTADQLRLELEQAAAALEF